MPSRFVRLRIEARNRGICTVCLRVPVVKDRAVCYSCNESAKTRVREWRKRKRTQASLSRAALSQEAAGDLARARRAYSEAIDQYGRALQCETLAIADSIRLSEKYANCLFYGRVPESASEWFERALTGYRNAGITSQNAREAGALLLRLARQSWLNAATPSSIALIGEALQLGMLAKDDEFMARCNLAMAHYLILLGRYDAAEPFFKHTVGRRDSDFPDMRVIALNQTAILHAAKGNRDEAYSCFESAVDAAIDQSDGYLATVVWDDYGVWATALGDLRTAQFCRERALFVAREHHIEWRIVYLSLRYADLLVDLHQYDRARDLFLDAITLDIKTPCVMMLMALLGTRLSLALGDRELLRHCNYDAGLRYAFDSGEPGRIGPLVSAVVNVLLSLGENANSRVLFRRGFASVRTADHACSLLLDAALLGDPPERNRARQLLEQRTRLPNCSLAVETLARFNAVVSPNMSTIAKKRLKAAKPFRSTLSDQMALTKREQDVAELVLKGLTNREIARRLWISENTVESHMTSIMNRLGVNSRHQLADHLS